MKKDYYEILGVAKAASAQDIKKKYRSLALQFHPDRVPEAEKKQAEERFKEISEAYGVLSDPQKRQLYDSHGHAGIDQNFTPEDIFRGADFNSIFEEMGLGDILGQVFGGAGNFDIFGSGMGQRGGGRRVQRGRDIQYEVDISLEEAYHGISKKIKVPRYEFCKNCQGSGAKPGTQPKTCSTCHGRGHVVMSSGFFRMQQTCSVCGGEGKVVTERCGTCQGQGMTCVTREIDVSIPAGVDNSSRLRVRGQGEIGRDGAGDLYLYIHVMDHHQFERRDKDLYLELPVSFIKAALGAEISVPTLDDHVLMKIPAGTQSGKTFRLKAKGMADVHGGTQGDQYVKVMIQVPTRLSAEERRLLEEYAKLTGEEVSANESFKEKIKKVFK